MGDRFYLQRDNLTMGFQPDRKPKTPGTPTYYLQKPTTMYPIPGKVYTFKGIEKVFNPQTGWTEVNPQEPEFPQNPKSGQVFKQQGVDFVFLPKKGWVKVSQISFF